MKLHQWIRAAREYAKLTQDQMGERLDRTKAMVSHWETGKNEPPYSTLVKLAEITGYGEPLPGIERFSGAADWPFNNISKEDFERLPAVVQEDIADYIQMKITKNKSQDSKAAAA